MRLLRAAALLCLAALPPVQAQTPPIRIMPLGDSITLGSSVPGGYRNRLHQLLTAAGYNVDFVGTQTGNGVAGLPDPDHQGHGGWRIDQLDANLDGWLAAIAQPDAVLLHIGTNDFGQNVDTTNAINRLDALILKITQRRPHARVIVTNLMQRGEPANGKITAEFNPFVQARVDAHAAAGRKVHFLDMRSAVPITDMPDNLHPNQAGYDKMADAWAPALQAVISPVGDASPPALVAAAGGADRTSVAVTFSKPVSDASASPANFAVNGLSVTGASLDATKRVVTLTTSEQTPGAAYTVTVNGVEDRTASPGPLAIAADSVIGFTGGIARGYQANAPESADYTLVYSLDLPAAADYRAGTVGYAVDNSALTGPFDRVAYYLELQAGGGTLQYVWASMDAFTTDARRLGVPTLASGAQFQQTAANLRVDSNVPGVLTGTNQTAVVEFWPYNYSAGNAAGFPGASGSLYDFGDTITAGGNYGSMQVHSLTAGKTLLAINNWGGNANPGNLSIGIGNQPTGEPDWTFNLNAAGYTVRTLHVLVRTRTDETAPVPLAAEAAWGRTQVTVTFSEPLSPDSVNGALFTLDGGARVTGARLSEDGRRVVLSTTTLPAALPVLAVGPVRDASPGANPVAPGTVIAVTGPALPPEIAAAVGAAADGYQVVCSADIPLRGNFNAGAQPYLLDDRAATGHFSRVAYFLETQRTGAAAQHVWVSMDAFSLNKRKLGVPTSATGAVFQQPVTGVEILSNVPGVPTGSGRNGNLEFWPTDYGASNAVAVAGASNTLYDLGDERRTTGTHGSFQVHDTTGGKTVFALNNWGADGNILSLGLGSQPTGNPDWTFAANTPQFFRRRLHVLVLPAEPVLPPEVAANVPAAAGYQLACTLNLPATGNLVSGAGFTNYAVDRRADLPSFRRVAYYLELQRASDPAPRFLWASMDAFTANPLQVGVPTPASGAVFQIPVSNLEVASNATAANGDPAAIVTGSFPSGGNLEFWPTNYSAPNAAAVPGASDSAYDWGDTRATTGGHGSMQVHNHGQSQVLFAINNWGAAGNSANALGLGIGNQPAGSPDWTFANNASTYATRRVLHVLVLPGNGDRAGPVITQTLASATRTRLLVSFGEPVSDDSADPAHFSLDGGLAVTGATLLPNQREIELTTSTQAAGAVYTLTVTGVRDRSPDANPITPGSTSGFTTPAAAEPVLAGVPEAAGYALTHKLAIPLTANHAAAPPAYAVDESRFPYAQAMAFDRAAWCLELVQGGTQRWVYVSADTPTPLVSRVGVPTLASGASFQRVLANANVFSSGNAGVTDGTGLATCNIEFWPTNYGSANSAGVPGASDSLYDWGDAPSAGNYASMQVHNHGAGQVLFAYNRWGGSAATSDVGIGNNPSAGLAGTGGNQGVDYTFSANAGAFTTRNLYALVRPGPSTAAGPVIQQHPFGRTVAAGSGLSLAVRATGALTYQWRRNGAAIPGATRAWLDLAAVTPYQAGDYDVVVTGAGGGVRVSQTATVTVTYAPAPDGDITANPDASAGLVFHGYPGVAHDILRSTNLVTWITLQTLVAEPDGRIPFTDPAPPFPRAYYRVQPAP